MSEDYLARQPMAMWNTVRGVWEKPEMVNLLCEHLEPFSETWPSAGTMRSGMVWRRQRQERRTEDFESSSLLRTPAASEAERGHQPEDKARARGGQVTLSKQFMHLPTPNTMDDLPARDESKIDRSKGGFSNVRETVVRPNFDRFEPAIRRWEAVTENPAPAPTKPDGKDGGQRLSSEFTEWMMGLQPGWVTSVGLSRKDELKACGNGVVPQQAKLALTILKARFTVQ